MRQSSSFEALSALVDRDSMLGPTQRQVLSEHPDNAPSTDRSLIIKTASRDPQQRSLKRLVVYCAIMYAVVCGFILLLTDITAAQLPKLTMDVALFRRAPSSAMDNPAAAMAFVVSLLPLIVVDYTVCAALCNDAGARWFLLHALGNMVVAAMCVPDFGHTLHNPPAAMSVAYCETLPFPACSNWPVCIIIAMHVYHMLSYKLSADDMFHHLLFVPVIGGMNFCYPGGALYNVLAFFISGLPGGISYLMLAAVKAGKLSSFTEKRINCSINTWVRGPGIVAFCALVLACWSRPAPGTPKEHMIPAYFFFPALFVAFFNGQYYAQRVIGNYYIRKAQDHAKRGIKRVDLHAS